jgi:hypothetical protein
MLFLHWPNSIRRAPSSVSTERHLSWGVFMDWQRYGEKVDKYALTGDGGDIPRYSSGKTSAIAFSAGQPHRLEALGAASNVPCSRGDDPQRTVGPNGSASLQNRLYPHQCQAGGLLLADRGSNLLQIILRCAPSPAYEISSFDRCHLFAAFLIPVATNPKREPQITLTTMPPMRPAVSRNGIDAVSSGLHVKNVCKKTAIATPMTA